jgi:hypothetical protein
LDLGTVSCYNHNPPNPLVYNTYGGNNMYAARTADRIMEYIELFTGTVNLRIHQNIDISHLVHATIPATYVFRPFIPDPLNQPTNKVACASGRTMRRHMYQFWDCESDRSQRNTDRTQNNIWNHYYQLINAVTQRNDTDLPLCRHILPLRWLKLVNGKERIQAEKAFLAEVYQGVSALHPDSTTPCPCCNAIGAPL